MNGGRRRSGHISRRVGSGGGERDCRGWFRVQSGRSSAFGVVVIVVVIASVVIVICVAISVVISVVVIVRAILSTRHILNEVSVGGGSPSNAIPGLVRA